MSVNNVASVHAEEVLGKHGVPEEKMYIIAGIIGIGVITIKRN